MGAFRGETRIAIIPHHLPKTKPSRHTAQGIPLLIHRNVLIAFPLVNLRAVHIPFDLFQLIEVSQRMITECIGDDFARINSLSASFRFAGKLGMPSSMRSSSVIT